MIYLKVQLNNLKPAMISFIAGSLKKGQVLIMPTDTIYGLSALADDKKALRRIYNLKKRDFKKPLIVLMSDLDMVKKYAVVSSEQAKKLQEVWGENKRPTTVILKNKGKLPKELVSPSGGLALRLPKSIFLIKILKALKRPLVSTSVNLRGESPLGDPREIVKYFPKKSLQPELIITTGKCRRTRPSRLIDLRDAARPLILRK
ncbi:MAG: L-threonylcarbamoyladenylate synthase [Patescibacteria group bacterium]